MLLRTAGSVQNKRYNITALKHNGNITKSILIVILFGDLLVFMLILPAFSAIFSARARASAEARSISESDTPEAPTTDTDKAKELDIRAQISAIRAKNNNL